MTFELTENKQGTGGFYEVENIRPKGAPFNILKPKELRRRSVVLLDASSPVPNDRASEIFFAVWAMLHLPKEVEVVSEISISGTWGEFASIYKILFPVYPKRNWQNFYPLTDLSKTPYTFAPMGITYSREKIISSRRRKIITLWKKLAPLLRENALPGLNRNIDQTLTVTCLEDVPALKYKSISDFLVLFSEGQEIGKFPCPVCSAQKGKITYHSLRMSKKQLLYMTPPGHGSASECHLGKAFLKNCNLTSLPDLIQSTGFIPGGILGVNMSALANSNSLALVRDYSNPRGNMTALVKPWKYSLISTRNYIRNTDGKDLGWPELIKAVKSNPSPWVEALKTPIISTGKTLHINP